MSTQAQQGRRGTTVESNGVNPVPDAERRGKPRGLFAVWFAWNISILGISYGIFVFGLGLNVWQTIVAGTAGYLISATLVGILAVGGPRTGLPTLAQTRFAFGMKGNRIPAFFAYLSNMGWKVTIITLASTTGANLFAKLWPSVFADTDGSSATSTIVLWFVLVLALTMTVSVLGHELIMKVEVWISWVTGIMTVAFLGFMVPEIAWAHLGDTPAGGPLVFIGGIIMAMTLVGLGFLNYGGDFARYLPRETPARGVISWTVTGLSLPVVILLAVGALLVGGDSKLGAATASDPIGALTALLPMWFFVPFSVVIVISLVSAAITGMYSSGLALMAVGVPLRRSVTTAINAIIIAAGAFYLLFISTSFLATFQSFLSLIAVMMGTMGGIQLIDFIRQRRMGWNTDLANPRGYGGRDGRWTAILSLITGTVVGLGLVTSSDPNFAKITGFLLTEEARTGVFGSSGLGIVIALVLGAALYAILTFGLRLDPKPDYSLVTAGDAARGDGGLEVPTPDAAGRNAADFTER
ncbi:cytosine permease [Streptomyces sp. MK37H]|uniref:purine-cytosine permease family protein n=1 Tax=Streptomyces sp. MK37H TaxID=2699117 RepID=UPI001B378C19|nr:cytosine permease [Streptomyces sp. MK37H]MBP8533655.1 permease [Streptomyces sp. MK37H]